MAAHCSHVLRYPSDQHGIRDIAIFVGSDKPDSLCLSSVCPVTYTYQSIIGCHCALAVPQIFSIGPSGLSVSASLCIELYARASAGVKLWTIYFLFQHPILIRDAFFSSAAVRVYGLCIRLIPSPSRHWKVKTVAGRRDEPPQLWGAYWLSSVYLKFEHHHHGPVRLSYVVNIRVVCCAQLCCIYVWACLWGTAECGGGNSQT